MLSDLMKKTFVGGLRGTWNEVAGDMFMSEDGDYDYSMTLDRDTVFGIAADKYVGELTDDGWRLWAAMTREEMEDLKMTAFPTKLYCA